MSTHQLTIRGNAPNRTPDLAGGTYHLHGGTSQQLDADQAAELGEWIAANGLDRDYRIAELEPTPVPRRSFRQIIGKTSGTKAAELIGRVEAAGFVVPDSVAKLRKKAELLEALATLVG